MTGMAHRVSPDSVGGSAAPHGAPQDPAPGTIARAWPRPAPPEAAGDGDDRPTWPAVRRGLAGHCPACGQGRLFAGYLKVVPACPSCGEDLSHQRADDGPAYLTILVVGHVVGFLMHVTWTWLRPEPLLFATSMTVVAVGLSLAMLPRVKGGLVAFQWARRMHGFGHG
jgi:uncharacterized protein (DUF983 family)